MSVALVALSMVAVTSVNAQPQQREPKSADEVAKMMTERMAKSLELTEDQSAKIYDINLKYIEERQTKMEQMKAERDAKRSECKESKADCDSPCKEGDREMRRGGERGMGEGRPMNPGRAPQQRGADKGMIASKKAMTKEIISVLTVDQIVEFIEIQSKMANRPQQGRPGMQQRGPERGPQGRHEQGRRPGHGRPERGPEGGDGPMCKRDCADSE